MKDSKTFMKNLKNIEKTLQLMKKYQISSIKVEGLEVIKNFHQLPETKLIPEKNVDNDPFLEELNKWPPQP